MDKKTIDTIACRLANGDKAVRTKMNHFSYIITLDSGFCPYGVREGEVFAQPEFENCAKNEACSGFDRASYAYGHGGKTFQAACDICDEIKKAVPEQKEMLQMN